MPESRGGHSCAALPSTGVRLDLDQPLTLFHFRPLLLLGVVKNFMILFLGLGLGNSSLLW